MPNEKQPYDQELPRFPHLPWLVLGMAGRTGDVDVRVDREEAVRRLEPSHTAWREALLGDRWPVAWAEQVHGAEIAWITEPLPSDQAMHPHVDGLITTRAQVALGIYVADCGAIWVIDPRTQTVGLLHSGKKGTELGILPRAISEMQARAGSRPEELIVILSPCIRPPAYEVDFAGTIRAQALAAGIQPDHFYDAGICTTSDPARYYSYRQEQGKTGRMLAVIGRRDLRRA
jgi:polyphenol oxidase